MDYLLSCTNAYFPRAQLTNLDIYSAWAGLRPLSAPKNKEISAYRVSRDHQIVESPGCLAISGGKLTTYRSMAKDVVDKALRQLGKTVDGYPCQTHRRYLPGAFLPEESTKDLLRVRGQQLGIQDALIEHWLSMYGSRVGEMYEQIPHFPAGWQELIDEQFPTCFAQVDFAVLREMACRLSDVLMRRFSFFNRMKDQGVLRRKSSSTHGYSSGLGYGTAE